MVITVTPKLNSLPPVVVRIMLEQFNREELRNLAKTLKIKRGKNKRDTISNLMMEPSKLSKQLSIKATINVTYYKIKDFS